MEEEIEHRGEKDETVEEVTEKLEREVNGEREVEGDSGEKKVHEGESCRRERRMRREGSTRRIRRKELSGDANGKEEVKGKVEQREG